MTDSPPPQEIPADRTATVAENESAAIAPPARPRRWPTLVFGALVGAALVFVGTWIAAERQYGQMQPQLDALLAQLQAANADRDTLRRDLAAVRTELAQTNERLTTTARAGEQPAADTARVLADLRTQVTDLSQRLEAATRTPTTDPAAVAALERRVAGIEAAATAPGATADATARAAAEALATRVTEAERALTAMRAAQPNPAVADAAARQVATLQARIEELERDARTADPAAAAGAAIVAATQLRERMRGDGPFAAELAAFRAALPRPADATLVPLLDSIAPIAPTGAPTAASLARELERAVETAQAQPDVEAPGWTDAVLRGMRNLVRVRRVGDVSDDAGRVERAHELLREGDAAGAVALVEQATPPLRTALAGWLTQARARATLDQAGAAIATRAVAIVAGAGTVAP